MSAPSAARLVFAMKQRQLTMADFKVNSMFVPPLQAGWHFDKVALAILAHYKTLG